MFNMHVAGVYKIPMEIIATSFCNAVMTYFQTEDDQTATLTDIRLIVVDGEKVDTVRHQFVKRIDQANYLERKYFSWN